MKILFECIFIASAMTVAYWIGRASALVDIPEKQPQQCQCTTP